MWSQWPDAGIGIAGGTVAAIDIDVVDPDVALAIERLAGERLGETPGGAHRPGAEAAARLPHRGAVQGLQAAADRSSVRGAAVRRVRRASRYRPALRVAGGLARRHRHLPTCRRSARTQARAFAEEAYAARCRSPCGRPGSRMATHHRLDTIGAGDLRGTPRRDRGGARLHPQRRSRLRQLDAHRHGAEGRARR